MEEYLLFEKGMMVAILQNMLETVSVLIQYGETQLEVIGGIKELQEIVKTILRTRSIVRDLLTEQDEEYRDFLIETAILEASASGYYELLMSLLAHFKVPLVEYPIDIAAVKSGSVEMVESAMDNIDATF